MCLVSQYSRVSWISLNAHFSTGPGRDFELAYSQPWGIQAVWKGRLLHDQAEISWPLWHDVWRRILPSLVGINFDFYGMHSLYMFFHAYKRTNTNTHKMHNINFSLIWIWINMKKVKD